MHVRLYHSCLLLCGVLAPWAASAGQDEPIQSDRPDFVDSSDVVGKGTVQVEAGFAVERNRDAGTKERTSSTPVLLRVGVSDTVELRFETDGRMRYRADGASPARERGWADGTLGVKWHVRDGEGRSPSIALQLEADVDSGSKAFRGNGVQPSLSMAAEWDLSRNLSLGVMPGVTRVRNDNGSHAVDGFFGVALEHAWTERLTVFAELAAPRIARGRNGGTHALADVGAMWRLNRDCQLDAMYSHGLNGRTPDHAMTLGLSFRL